MHSFLIRRLLPFFVFTLVTEFLVFALLIFSERESLDWGMFSMAKTSGVLLLTTLVSFLYMMIPYVLYLLFLPRRLVNGRADRILTTAAYAFYIYLTLFEEAASFIFWEEFSSAFNFIAVDYLVYTHEVISNIYQSYPIVWYLLGILSADIVIVVLSRKRLFTSLEAPVFGRRLFDTAIYGALCALTFVNVDIANLEVAHNRFNNELANSDTITLRLLTARRGKMAKLHLQTLGVRQTKTRLEKSLKRRTSPMLRASPF